jgi:hypothetical protein
LKVIELKKGLGAVAGTSGVKEHIDCFTYTIAKDDSRLFNKEMQILLEQKQRLKLLDQSLSINNNRPSFAFAFADEAGKDLTIVAVRLQPSANRLNEIEERPATDDDVVREYHERDEHASNSLDAPPLARCELCKRMNRIGVSVTANKELAHHDRDAYHSDAEEIDKDECRATIIADFSRETPHIAQAHCRARGCQHSAYLATKVRSFFHRSVLFALYEEWE